MTEIVYQNGDPARILHRFIAAPLDHSPDRAHLLRIQVPEPPSWNWRGRLNLHHPSSSPLDDDVEGDGLSHLTSTLQKDVIIIPGKEATNAAIKKAADPANDRAAKGLGAAANNARAAAALAGRAAGQNGAVGNSAKAALKR